MSEPFISIPCKGENHDDCFDPGCNCKCHPDTDYDVLQSMKINKKLILIFVIAAITAISLLMAYDAGYFDPPAPKTFEGWVDEVNMPIRTAIGYGYDLYKVPISRNCLMDITHPANIAPYPKTVTHCERYHDKSEIDAINYVLSMINDEIFLNQNKVVVGADEQI